MELGITFVDSAFRHGYTEDDIRHAIRTKIKDAPMKGYINKYMLVGFNCAGNLIEVGYNPIDLDTISVFHCKKCSKEYLPDGS